MNKAQIALFRKMQEQVKRLNLTKKFSEMNIKEAGVKAETKNPPAGKKE